eukprot:6492501-Amphidinium_carterae.2
MQQQGRTRDRMQGAQKPAQTLCQIALRKMVVRPKTCAKYYAKCCAKYCTFLQGNAQKQYQNPCVFAQLVHRGLLLLALPTAPSDESLDPLGNVCCVQQLLEEWCCNRIQTNVDCVKCIVWIQHMKEVAVTKTTDNKKGDE